MPVQSRSKGKLFLETGESKLYARHEGGLLSRALGTAVHAPLEELARLRRSNEWPEARAALQKFEPRIAARIRALGIDPTQAAIVASEALQSACTQRRKPTQPANGFFRRTSRCRCRGSLGRSVVAGSVSTVRVDRIFRAGLMPESDGEQAWWIVDYKAAQAGSDSSTSLPALRTLFAPQRKPTRASSATSTAATQRHPRRSLLSPHAALRIGGNS